MSYESVVDSMETMIKLHADYSDANVAQANPSVYGQKPGKIVVILWPGTWISAPRAADRRVDNKHGIIIEWSHRIGDNQRESYDLFIAKRQIFLDHIRAYPTFNGGTGVTMWEFTGGSIPIMWSDEHGEWWTQVYNIVVTEKQTIPILE